jgi:hypothetical protein
VKVVLVEKKNKQADGGKNTMQFLCLMLFLRIFVRKTALKIGPSCVFVKSAFSLAEASRRAIIYDLC